MKVNYSFSSVRRSRCKFCNSKPKYHFIMMNKGSSKNPKAFHKKYDYAMNYINILSDSHLLDEPKDITNMLVLSYRLFHNKIDIKFHKNYKEINSGLFTDNALTCECSRTMWKFKNINRYPHTQNKAARFEYDDKFICW